MGYQVMKRGFFEADVVSVARQLLGKLLVHCTPEGTTSGIIVETEAYSSKDDPACHAYKGKTKRNEVMFGPAGRAYVYFIYGNHYCFNVVTNRPGTAEAVLVRALEPVDGIELMQARRGSQHPVENLTSGPGKLCSALSIGKAENNLPVYAPPLFIAQGKTVERDQVGVSRRIGISAGKEKNWRYFVQENPFVSRLR